MLCSASPPLSPSNLSLHPGSDRKSPVTALACPRLSPPPLMLAASDSPYFTPSSSYANSPHPHQCICFCTTQRQNSLVLARGAALQWEGFGSVGIFRFSHTRHLTEISAAPQNLAEAMPVRLSWWLLHKDNARPNNRLNPDY